MGQIEVKTTDKELTKELQLLNIDEVQVGRRINTFDSCDPEVMASANQVATFIITVGGSVALNLLSSWLYDRLKSGSRAESTKINGIEISGDNNNLKVEVHNHIHSSESKGE